MVKKRVTKEPYEGYNLPDSSNKGVSFLDFNEPYKSKIPVKRVVKIKKRVKKDE